MTVFCYLARAYEAVLVPNLSENFLFYLVLTRDTFSIERNTFSLERDSFSFERDNFSLERDRFSFERDNFSLERDKKKENFHINLALKRLRTCLPI